MLKISIVSQNKKNRRIRIKNTIICHNPSDHILRLKGTPRSQTLIARVYAYFMIF